MKPKSISVALGLALALFGASSAAWTHHSGAMFDRSRTIEITGVVKEFMWTNPHASFKVEVPSAQGEAQLWFIEMNGVSNLVHEGWKRSSIKPGDRVTVTVNPLRDGRPGGWYLAIKLANGDVLDSYIDEIIFERIVVTDIALLLAFFHTIERRLSNTEIAIFDDSRKLTIEEG